MEGGDEIGEMKYLGELRGTKMLIIIISLAQGSTKTNTCIKNKIFEQ